MASNRPSSKDALSNAVGLSQDEQDEKHLEIYLRRLKELHIKVRRRARIKP